MTTYGGSSPGKLAVTKSNTAGQASLGVASLTGAGAGTASAWGQISASLASDTLVSNFTVNLTGATAAVLSGLVTVDIGYGGAGSETVLATVPVVPVKDTATTAKTAHGLLAFPIRVASGARLAVRIKGESNLTGVNPDVTTYGTPYVNLEGN